MILLASIAAAEGLPWTCPSFAVPSDANVLRDAEVGITGEFTRLVRFAQAYEDLPCDWIETTTSDGGGTTSTERVCEGDGYTVVASESDYDWSDGSGKRSSGRSWTLLVTVESGEPWTRIEASYSTSSGTGTYDWGTGEGRAATWEGTPDGFPADGFLSVSSSESVTYIAQYRWSRGGSTPDCSYGWFATDDSAGYRTESVSANEQLVETETPYECPRLGLEWARAELDGVPYGIVEASTWEYAEGDGDGDGFTIDCDDTDPAINYCATDIPDDGIDQDCTGGDESSEPEDTAPPDTAPPDDTDTAVPEEEAPAEDTDVTAPPSASGCGGGAGAWLLLAPLLGLGRGRRAPG